MRGTTDTDMDNKTKASGVGELLEPRGVGYIIGPFTVYARELEDGTWQAFRKMEPSTDSTLVTDSTPEGAALLWLQAWAAEQQVRHALAVTAHGQFAAYLGRNPVQAEDT